jgi:hypothetical protein
MVKDKSIKFSSVTIDDIVEMFGLEVDYTGAGLEFWLDKPQPITEQEVQSLESLRKILISNVANWNEFELEILFISPLISMVNFYDVNVKPFIERTIAGEVNGIAMHGEVDWIISKGFGRPKAPFFCLKEFKKAKNSSNDPEGQLAAAMLVARVLNKNEKPIYGAYVVGREWIFTILTGQKLIQSLPLMTTDPDDLKKILAVLKNLKDIIAAEAKNTEGVT